MPPVAPAPSVVAPAIAAGPFAPPPVPPVAQSVPVYAAPEPSSIAPAQPPEPSVAGPLIDNDAPEPELSATPPEPFAAPKFAHFDDDPSPVFADPPLPPPAPTPVASYFDELPPPSRFAHEPPFKARRNPAKLWTMAAVAFALLIASAGAAIWYFGLPATGFGMAVREPDLKIVLNENLEMNQRDDGTTYFIASGSIVNPTATTQDVPEMLVTLKDTSGRAVYSWKMRADARTLAPGAKVNFSEARVDIPLAAKQINVGWVLNNR